jgi:hypothetical protein
LYVILTTPWSLPFRLFPAIGRGVLVWDLENIVLSSRTISHKLISSSYKGHFTLWSKVERPLIFTNQIARNQEFGLSALHIIVTVAN